MFLVVEEGASTENNFSNENPLTVCDPGTGSFANF